MAPFNNNEKLSELVKLYPCLYNKQEKDLKKEDIKQRAWNQRYYEPYIISLLE